MTKITLTIRDELRARMKQFDNKTNWSALASTTFETMVEREEYKKNTINTDNIKMTIERLRMGKGEHEREIAQEGEKDGVLWARDLADYNELVRLEKYLDDADRNYPLFDEQAPAQNFLQEISGDANSRIDKEELENMLGDDYETYQFNAAYVKAFAEGAMEVWAKVKNEI